MLEYFFHTFFWTNALFSYVAKAMFYIRNSTLWFNHNQQQQLSDKSSWDERLPKFCIAGILEIHLFHFTKISWLTMTFRWTDSHPTIFKRYKTSRIWLPVEEFETQPSTTSLPPRTRSQEEQYYNLLQKEWQRGLFLKINNPSYQTNTTPLF